MSKKVCSENLSGSEFIKMLAKELGGQLETHQNETTLSIPKNIGEGFFKVFEFDYGVQVLELDYTLKQDLTLILQNNIVEPLRIIFNREASFYHGNTEKDLQEVKRLENIMVGAPLQEDFIFKSTAQHPTCLLCLEINRKLFEEKIQDFLPNMSPDLVDLFRDVNGINGFYHKSHFSLEIAKFLKEFTSCELEDFMRSVYLEGKAYEIITHQLQLYLDDLNSPDKRKILRQATIERIEEATRIIDKEYSNMDSIVKLAKRVGLNQNTLQDGFQKLYKVSVNKYIRDYRIEKAKHLLETTDLTISEITYKIGFNSRSYFSKLFKEKYRMTPKNYIKDFHHKMSS